MQRVLDIDLDFFQHGTEHWAGEGRLDAADYPPWAIDEVVTFLRGRCQLDGPLPGSVVEYHHEVFVKWREAIEAGILVPPFHVTHVDAHADLGLGDNGYMYLMSSLLFEEVEDRCYPIVGSLGGAEGGVGLAASNWLLFAIACRWISDLVYVVNSEGNGRPGDLLYFVMEGFNLDASQIQLAAVERAELRKAIGSYPGRPGKIERLEPPISFTYLGWPKFQAAEVFDFVFLAHSPEYTSPEADPIFDLIRERFVDETAFAKR